MPRDAAGIELMNLLAAMLLMDMEMSEAIDHLVRYLCTQALETRVAIAPMRFSLAALDSATCRRRFRFVREEIEQLEASLSLPVVIYAARRIPVPRQEALCLLLRRLGYPCRLCDLAPEFGRSPQTLSLTINATATYIYEKIKTKMLYDRSMIERYKRRSADAVYVKVGRLRNCFGFIDGTVRPICRPTRYERQVYSGHKKLYCIKFQGITLANGLIVSLIGPVEGRRHDGFMLAWSQVDERLAQNVNYYLYGDRGYPLRRWLITPYGSGEPTADQRAFNRDLGRARIAIEWAFGWIVRYWKYFELRSNMKVMKSPVGMFYILAAFFTNCISCLRHKNQASMYFHCKLPSLKTYLSDLTITDAVGEASSSDGSLEFSEADSDMSNWEGDDSSIGSIDEMVTSEN